ncbi:DUF262 domain-containing protein [Clostridium sp. ZS1]|uniref:DUF262 domain-containing protein n=1 Tax=Clostridium sp. ZS1 TaxID=2949989 RepID=UPI002079935C|nr:DUF262 domain-containing protein [Clostridium sp. ZS1]
MSMNTKESYRSDNENPEFEGEESLNPQNEEDNYHTDSINIDQGYFSVFELKRKYDRTKKQRSDKGTFSNEDRRNQIILDSDFQREVVWYSKQKSELIESVLMGLPIPIMYLYEDKFANLVVVDGRQRLTAFFEFLDEEFELTGLKILKKLNGKKFGQLDPVYQSKLEDYQLITQIIKPPTPDSVIFNVFDRVNRGGTSLNKQEMRNALYQGNSTKLLDIIAKSQAFKDATGKSVRAKRMKDKYLILRAIAFYLWSDKKLTNKNNEIVEYKGDIDELLGKTMEYLNFISEDKLEEISNKFNRAMINTSRILGEDAFRLKKLSDGRKSPINMNVFEGVVYVMITLNNREWLDELIRERYYSLITDTKFLDNIANHRDSVNKFEIRRDIIIDKFQEVMLNDR